MHFQRVARVQKNANPIVLPIKSGMQLELHEKVGEGKSARIQKFKGLVLQVKKPQNADGTFTIRGKVAGIDVEKIFPLSFQNFDKVLLVDEFKTRRANIGFIREKVGRDAKMKSLITTDRRNLDLLELARQAAESATPTEKVDEKVEEKVEEKIDTKIEENTPETPVETPETTPESFDTTAENSEGKTEEKVEDKNEEKSEKNPETKVEEKIEETPTETPDDTTTETPEQKSDDTTADKTAENPTENPEETPDQKSA